MLVRQFAPESAPACPAYESRQDVAGGSPQARPHVSRTFPTKAEAFACAIQAERHIKIRQPHLAFHNRTLGDLLERYSAEVSVSKPGRQWEQTRILHFLRDPIAKTPLSDLSPQVLVDWRDRRLREVTKSTITRDMALLSHALTTARNIWRWISDNPMSVVSRPGDNPSRERRITEEESSVSGSWPATISTISPRASAPSSTESAPLRLGKKPRFMRLGWANVAFSGFHRCTTCALDHL